MRYGLLGWLVLHAMWSTAQVASAPDEPLVPPLHGMERVDLTGDGIADLLIEGRVDRTPDPSQGLEGWYLQCVRTLPGTALLVHSTHHRSGPVEWNAGERIDTAALSAGFRYKQLMWTPADGTTELRVLKQAFGPGISKEVAIWLGTGEQREGTMVLRSTLGAQTRLASFRVIFTLPAGTVRVVPVEVIDVPHGYGAEGDPPAPAPVARDPFGGEWREVPQRKVPPGLPPEEGVDLDGDDVPDVLITGAIVHPEGDGNGAMVERGVSPGPGAAFLFVDHGNGLEWLLHLKPGDTLSPDSLARGLASGHFRWVEHGTYDHLYSVMHIPEGADARIGWQAMPEGTGAVVFRSNPYGRPLWGVFEVQALVPAGEIHVDLVMYTEMDKPIVVPSP
ncbi:MAG: hypothetical protein KDB84_12655 [Flavobacteriales bacterium]|nr:hypothetical protein [Flavobacteriales bacterium]